MIEHITLLSLVAFIVFIGLFIVLTYLWLECRDQLKYSKNSNRIAQDLQKKWLGHVIKNNLSLKEAKQLMVDCCNKAQTPWIAALQSLRIKHIKRKKQDTISNKLQLSINNYYYPLTKKVITLRTIAPVSGMLFTVLGLIMVLSKQSQGLNQQQMVGDMAVALVTTACSSFMLIILAFVTSKINSLKFTNHKIGMQTIKLFIKNRNDIEQNFNDSRGGNHE